MIYQLSDSTGNALSRIPLMFGIAVFAGAFAAHLMPLILTVTGWPSFFESEALPGDALSFFAASSLVGKSGD